MGNYLFCVGCRKPYPRHLLDNNSACQECSGTEPAGREAVLAEDIFLAFSGSTSFTPAEQDLFKKSKRVKSDTARQIVIRAAVGQDSKHISQVMKLPSSDIAYCRTRYSKAVRRLRSEFMDFVQDFVPMASPAMRIYRLEEIYQDAVASGDSSLKLRTLQAAQSMLEGQKITTTYTNRSEFKIVQIVQKIQEQNEKQWSSIPLNGQRPVKALEIPSGD
jgi:hypothetical protein